MQQATLPVNPLRSARTSRGLAKARGGVCNRASSYRETCRGSPAQSNPDLAGHHRSYTWREMNIEPVQPRRRESLELPVDELVRRARPLPPHEAMVIDDLSEEEGAAFLAALEA